MTGLFLSTYVRDDPFHFSELFVWDAQDLLSSATLCFGVLANPSGTAHSLIVVAEAVGAVGNVGALLPRFSKACGKALA